MIALIFTYRGKHLMWESLVVVESDNIQAVKDILNGAMVSSYLTSVKNRYWRLHVEDLLSKSGIKSKLVRTSGEYAYFKEHELKRVDKIYDIKYRIYLNTTTGNPFTIGEEVDLTV